jgi:hypothetical protein
MHSPLRTAILALIGVFAIGVPAASGSLTIATNVQAPSLRVDAAGNAEIDWTSGGARHTLLVRPGQELLPGARVGRDVSRAWGTALPFRRVVRRGPGGWLWALQAWRVLPGGPIELRVAHWRGPLPELTLTLENGNTLVGSATTDGRPISRYSLTFARQRLRIYVYLDALVNGTWSRIGGVAPQADFRRFVPTQLQSATKFRAILIGPSDRTTVTPDVLATATP